jgi:tRNA(adenine34) deaminase
VSPGHPAGGQRHFLELATYLAKQSFDEGCTPVGCVLAYGENIISTARSTRDKVGGLNHAEISLLLNNQAYVLESHHKLDIYTSCEPCLMCYGAIMIARIKSVVWAMNDHWGGATGMITSTPYIVRRQPLLVASPYEDLQRENAQMWYDWLDHGNGFPEYIEPILGKQLELLS